MPEVIDLDTVPPRHRRAYDADAISQAVYDLKVGEALFYRMEEFPPRATQVSAARWIEANVDDVYAGPMIGASGDVDGVPGVAVWRK